MNSSLPSRYSAQQYPFLAGGGDMAERFCNHDWGATPLGEPETWPQAVRTLVGLMLSASQPMFLAWGHEHLLLYNDGYAPMLGERQLGALGAPFFVVWQEVVEQVGPLFAPVPEPNAAATPRMRSTLWKSQNL